MENKNIYKGLECHCNEFEKIPIHRRELGRAGDMATYGVAITEGFAIYGTEKYLNNMNIKSSTTEVAKLKIKMNFGILSFLQAKIEGKSNERALTEVGVGIGVGYAMETKAAQLAVKTGISLLTRIATGAAAGAAVGSSAPIVGTIIGAVAGALIAGVVNDIIFAEEDKQTQKDKAENELIKYKESQYQNKINRINDYLIRNHYIELRELDKDKYGNPIPNSNEAEELCKEASNLKSGYFKTIMLMLSFPNYLDKDKAFYDDFQQKETSTSKDSNNTESKDLKIKPIADSISITLEIDKCYDESHMNKAKSSSKDTN